MNAIYDDSSILEVPVSTERVYDGLILHIDIATNRLPNGHLAKREIARHVGAAAVLPLDDEGNVYLVRQYRAPLDRVLMEIPAGKLDSKSEDHLKAAKRELHEETGLTARNWRHLIDMHTTVGFCDECISIYLARDLSCGESAPDEDEFLNVVRMPLQEAVRMVTGNALTDSKTVAALALTQLILSGEE